MKIFVWFNVLEDYTSGMIVVLAKDLETARKALDMSSVPELSRHYYNASVTAEMLGKEPGVVADLGPVHYYHAEPLVWYVYGWEKVEWGCKFGQKPLPDDHWIQHWLERCYFYPGRDCPGWSAGGNCSRIGDRIPEDASDSQ